jgi:hypothetical protein
MAAVIARNGFDVSMQRCVCHSARSLKSAGLHSVPKRTYRIQHQCSASQPGIPRHLRASKQPSRHAGPGHGAGRGGVCHPLRAPAGIAGLSLCEACPPRRLTRPQSIAPFVPAAATLVSTSKGLHSQTLEMMCDLLPRVLPGRPACFVSGPSFAKVCLWRICTLMYQELMDRRPTGLVLASSGSPAPAQH